MRHTTTTALIALLIALALGGTGCTTTRGAKAAAAPAAVAKAVDDTPFDARQHVVRVSVTSQAYDYFNPWRKQAPGSKSGIGVLLEGGDILVTARLVENATYVELENMLEGQKGPASVAFVDYTANLALLHAESDDVMTGLSPIAVVDNAEVGDAVTAWQFEDNGTPFLTDGVVRAIEMGAYPYAGMSFMTYNIELSLTTGNSSYTIPVVRDNALIGLLMGYNANTKIVQLVSSPVIHHFLADKADGQYDGFPFAGFAIAPLDDKQLRNFVGVGDQALDGGVFVTYVRPQGPADRAGLKEGDVLVKIGGRGIDKHGEFDDTEYGKMALSFLISTRSHVGDALSMDILRDGQAQTLSMTLDPFSVDDFPVKPFELDQQPEYIMVGGLVFMELNRQFLMGWGANYEQNAPNRLVYLESHQWELMQPGQRQVLMTRVIPSVYTNGYQQFLFLPLTKCNGQDIHSIHDLAKALEAPQGDFHKFEYSEQPYTMYLQARLVDYVNQQLKQAYKLPATENLRPQP